jgi:lysophospholipase L1-like esterase
MRHVHKKSTVFFHTSPLFSLLPLLFIAAGSISGNSALAAGNDLNFSNFVIAGDSLSAGYQNSQLIDSGQLHSYASVIAAQAGVDLKLPLLPPPGYPQISITDGFALDTEFNPTPRLNIQQTRNVSVPGFTVGALVGYPAACNPSPVNNPLFPIQVMAAEILNPGCLLPAPTLLAEAAALRPSTSILWVGGNDALFALLFAGPPTSPETFRFLYDIAASTMAAASGHLILANIPDVTLVPYLTSIDKLSAALNVPAPLLAGLGLNPGDMVTPYAFQFIQMNGLLTPLPDTIPQGPVVIRASMIAQIKEAVAAYNTSIAEEAAFHHATLVDIHSLVNDLAAHGMVVNGQKLTTDFMGGLFSLDGIHPTNTGYAIIANEFIKTMNRSMAAGIPPVSVVQVSKTDPLIFPADHPGRRTGHVSERMADALRAVMR